MQEILTPQNLIYCSLFVLGMKKILSTDGVLPILSYPMEGTIANAAFHENYKAANLLRYFSKPLYYCYPCMASVWGVTYLVLSQYNNWWIEWGLFIVILCGVNVVIGTVIERLSNTQKSDL